MKNLQDIPRIGDKMAQRFIEHFGSEEAALDSILEGDIASISEVEGIGQRYAISLVHEVRADTNGVTISDFLKTKEAIDIYERLLDIIKQFAHTQYAKDKLHIYIPYPSNRIDLIESVRISVSDQIHIASLLHDDTGFIETLSQVQPLSLKCKPPMVRDRAILTGDQEQFEYARARFADVIDVQMVSTPTEFVDLARGYSHSITADENLLGIDLPEDIEPEFVPDLRKTEDWQIIPEKEIAFFAKNLRSIKASISIIKTLRREEVEFFPQMKNDELETLEDTLSHIDDEGDVSTGTDSEIDRLNNIIENIDDCISRAVLDANERLNRCLEESKLTLSGQDMLKVMSGQMELKQLLEKEVYHSYSQVIDHSREQIAKELSLEKKEILMLDSLFPDEISHPVEVDQEQLYIQKQHLMQRIQKKKIQHKRNVARTLHKYHGTVRKMVKEVLDFGVGFAIGCFAHEHSLTMPEIVQKPGIGFANAENLFIKTKHGEVTPITYSVGKNKFSPEDNSPVILLSGVNSGGKTSMLELLAQCIILSHMGFPTPARSLEIGLTDGMYYFAKSKGTLDAGAFETTLTDFSVVADSSSKVVLVDELESITEPGASAKIIAGILEALCENDKSMSVFVSHLSELILENTQCSLRVDGIEASGLDEDLNLMVDRTPRYNYIAKSTPELIVERLARRTSGDKKAFYERLRSKF